MKNTLSSTLIFLSILLSNFLSAQNTIGGKIVTVPEEEVNRQSEFLTAESERLLGHYDKAMPLYEKFTMDYPDNDAAWYGLARTYTQQKELPKAIDAIQKAIKIDPKNVWYQIYFADLMEQTGRIRDAVQIYETLTKNNPNVPEFFQKMAHLQVLSGDPKNALKSLEKVEKIAGISEETSRSKHLIYIGLGDQKRAAAELEKLANAFPGEVDLLYDLADFYEKTGDKNAARKIYEQILKENPDDPVAQIAILDKPKNSNDANYLQSLHTLFANPKVDIDAKIKELLPYFDKIGKMNDPSLVSGLLILAADLEAAHPTEAKAWSISGDLFYQFDRLPEALERYQKCIALNPSVFSVWANSMDILLEQKRFADLQKMSENAMDAFPNQPLAYLNFGLAANENGQSDNALRQLQQGILMTGNNADLRLDFVSQIGVAYLKKKNFEEAKKRLEATISKGGERHPGILEHLGDAYFGLGEKEKAVDFWKKSSAIQPSTDLEKKISGNQ